MESWGLCKTSNVNSSVEKKSFDFLVFLLKMNSTNSINNIQNAATENIRQFTSLRYFKQFNLKKFLRYLFKEKSF